MHMWPGSLGLIFWPYGMSRNSISRCRNRAAEIWEKYLARTFKCLPVGVFGQRRDRDKLAIFQPSNRGVDNIFGRHDCVLGHSAKLHAGRIPEVGGRCPRKNDLDTYPFVREFVVKRSRECENEGLASAIHAV